MYIDKKKSKNKEYRISEWNLLLVSIFGGSIGSLIGMYKFRHKTKKKKFIYGIPFILFLQVIFLLYLLYIYYFIS